METGTSQKEQNNEVDNFTIIDMDVLLMQNKSLATELVRLKEAAYNHEKNHEIITQNNNVMNEVYNRTKQPVNHFLHLFENFALKSGLKWVYNLYEVVSGNLNDFVDLLDIGRNMKASSFDLVYKFEELFTNNLGLFNFDYNKLESDKNHDNKEIELLIKRNTEFIKEVKELQDEINVLKEQSPEYKELRDEVELLAWKNKILENRVAFLTEFDFKDINKVLEAVDNMKVDLCYCGGKSFKPLKDEIKNTIISKIPAKTDNTEKKLEAKVDENTEIKFNLLKKELSDLIEVAEKRRVDKIVVGKQILNSNFIYDIKQYLNDYYEYVKELEMRIETYNDYLIDIERERAKELERYKLKELKEKQRLENEINDLNQKLIALENQPERSKLVKQETTMTIDAIEKINKLDEIVKNQASTIETLTSKMVKNIDEKVIESKKIVSYLEKKLYSYKDKDILNSKYLDKEFRHSTHKRIFEKLYKFFDNDSEMVGQLKDMEKYVKAREEKINSLEKKVKKYNEQLETEQGNSKALLQEIANNSSAFQKIQAIEESQRSDLKIAEDNFTKLYKESSDQKVKHERKILELKNDLESKNTELENSKQSIKTLKQYIVQKDYELNDANRKIKELSALLTNITADKDKLKAESDQKDTELVILTNKLQTVENSVSKLSSQIADNLAVIAEKESIIKSIIASSRNQEGDLSDISTAQKEEYFVNKLELKRLRDLIICKVCHVNEKSVVLATCFHTFCHDCIQQKLKSRDRNCPVCMVKINKYDVKKLYFG